MQEPGIAPIDNEGNGLPTAAIVGLLALLGIGGAGIAAMRSRRRRDPVTEPAHTTIPAPHIEPEVATPRASAQAAGEPVTAAPRVSSSERLVYPAMAGAAMAAPSVTGSVGRPVEEPARSANEDALVLDRETSARETPSRSHRPIATHDLDGPVGTGEAREQLLRDMVAAEPDESNPFLSPKARRRRARVILQHREAMQRDGSDTRFDWRTYKPTTKAAAPADEPMVPA